MKYNIKCSQCSKDKFVTMPLTASYSNNGYFSQTSINSVDAYLCLNCGHIELFSSKIQDDLAKLNKMENRLSEFYKELENPNYKNTLSRLHKEISKILELHNGIINVLKTSQKLTDNDDISKLKAMIDELWHYVALASHSDVSSSFSKLLENIFRSEDELVKEYIKYIEFINDFN